jgi:hypothetical protein
VSGRIRDLTRADRLRLCPVVHEVCYASRLVGLRNRLRCPDCRAVGTYKPHGARRARRGGDRPVRRWLCKWCGYYVGPEGVLRCYPDMDEGCWVLPLDGEAPRVTPAVAVEAALGKVWPWVG